MNEYIRDSKINPIAQCIATYSFWNMMYLSASRSDMSILFPYSFTFGCLRDINHPTWLKKNPRFALCGSASVSEYLWCCRWSRTHTYKQFFEFKEENRNKRWENTATQATRVDQNTWPARVCNHSKKIFNPVLALNARWDHKRCAPMVTPKPDPYIRRKAVQRNDYSPITSGLDCIRFYLL